MSKALAKSPDQSISAQTLASVILHGDLKALTPVQRVEYYNKVCSVVGLNPLTKPFDYMTFQGKDVLYANKGCAEQLRSLYSVSLKVTQVQTLGDIYVVVVEASMPNGRIDSASAAIALKGIMRKDRNGNYSEVDLRGDDLANAFMKCETKAKRRATLSICGLNMLDESELDSVPAAVVGSAAPTVVVPEPPAPAAAKGPILTRKQLSDEIKILQQSLCLEDTDLAQWALNSSGKDNMKAMSIEDIVRLRDEMHNEAAAESNSKPR
jgi:hypothetical protein